MKITFHQKLVLQNESGKFLALKATYKGLKWELPGGEVEMPELNEEALRRELLEETGIELHHSTPVYVRTGYDKDNDTYYIFAGYVAYADEDSVRLSKEHDEYRWVTLDEFIELGPTPYLIDFAKTALASKVQLPS